MSGAFSSAFSSGFDVYQPPIIDEAQTNYGFHSPFSRTSKRRRVDVEEDDEKQPIEVVKIGEGSPREIVTGLVMPRSRKPLAVTADHLEQLSKASVEGERARAERIRRNIAASNAWLMTV